VYVPTLLIFFVAGLFIQANPELGDVPRSVLRLETRLISQSYCRRQPLDKMNVELKLQLKFTNLGDEPVILYRKCDSVERISRSATVEDALARKYEENWNVMLASVFPHLVSGKEAFPPQDYFVVLRPGESHYLIRTVGFEYCLPARQGCPALTGEHYLSVVFGTWKEPPKLAEQLRKRWRVFGMLWDENVTSEPMRFTVVDRPSAPSCPAPGEPGPFI
jgi:hypothetical protein